MALATTSNPAASLIAAMSRAVEVESTSEATRLILQGLLDATGANAGRILFLDLRTGCFHQRSHVRHESHRDIPPIAAYGHSQEDGIPPLDILDIAARSRRPASWSQHDKSAPSLFHEASSQHRLVQPVIRAGTVIALLDIEGRAPLSLSLGLAGDFLTGVISQTYERRFTLRLLHELKRPIRANRDRTEFHSELAALISASSGMEFVAIREYDRDDDYLDCVAADGLPVEKGQLHELDLHPANHYPSFSRALSGETVAEPTIAADHLALLREKPHLKDVRSFAALPIVVGDEILGVLSVAARCPYFFSRMELRGFETVSNAIGVAMANFKNLHANSDQVRRLAQVSAGAVGDLLAQAARHEAKGYLDNAQKRLNLVSRSLSGKGTMKDPAAEITRVSNQLRDTRDALDKMKTNALIRPGQSPARADIRSLVLDATDQVSGELESYDINITVPPGGAYVQVIPEAMRLAFLNLLQNSIYAFSQIKKKRGRAIDITVAARPAGSETVTLRFADNATGVEPGRLSIPDELKDMPWQEAIFERGVTGSTDGTGFGLYLVRTLVRIAGGGAPGEVRLIEHKNRTVFELELPAAD